MSLFSPDRVAEMSAELRAQSQGGEPTASPAVPSGDWWSQNAFTAAPAVPSGSAPVAQGDQFSTMQPQMQTGGGQYPLASVTGEGLMAPWTTPFLMPPPASQTEKPYG